MYTCYSLNTNNQNTETKMEKKTISHADILEIISMTAATVNCFVKGEISKKVALEYINDSNVRDEFKEPIRLVIEELSKDSPEGSDYDIDKVYHSNPFYSILRIYENNGLIFMEFEYENKDYRATIEEDRDGVYFVCERLTGYSEILEAMWDLSKGDVNLQKLMECVNETIPHL